MTKAILKNVLLLEIKVWGTASDIDSIPSSDFTMQITTLIESGEEYINSNKIRIGVIDNEKCFILHFA